ncbi:hypothetical protein B0H10DRAFT_1953160 [Mycena sp. CBHHK59/15]|nr:hypothetical protein B0H10DRAFT_1953160 [Mycena sp. CBHHK59/15]
MTQYGGPAMDVNVNKELEHPVPAGKKKKGLPADTIIKITAALPKPLTKKEQQGNATKWTLEHLPRLLNSPPMLSLSPASSLIQGIVNCVYKQGKVEGEDKPRPIIHKVTKNGPWWDLTAVSNAPPKLCPFKFDTPKGIANFVNWALQVHADSGTSAFHWRQWGDGKEKKGFLFLYLIVYTYVHHLTVIDTIPDEYKHSTDPPYGVILLVAQATGEYTVPKGLFVHFSVDNWGDIRTQEAKKPKLTRRVTKFLYVLKKWDAAQWEELQEAAAEWQEKKKQAVSSSRGKLEAEDMEETEEEELIVLFD